MNERISELCHQAYKFANSNCCDEFGSVDEYKRRSKFEEKFAELIVKECYALVDYENKQFIKSQFKEYFGVE